MIDIINIRNKKPCKEYDVIVDRRSVLGNPFILYEEFDRDLVCDKYEHYFNNIINNKQINQPFINKLQHLIHLYEKHHKLRLFCWCYPKRCHSETIRNYILSNINNDI